MDPNKLFEYLTWADLTIDGDELQIDLFLHQT